MKFFWATSRNALSWMSHKDTVILYLYQLGRKLVCSFSYKETNISKKNAPEEIEQ